MRKQAVKQAFENNSMEVALEALAESIARWTDQGDQLITAIPGLSLFRRIEPTQPASGMYEPSLCLSPKGPNACCSETTRMCMTRTII